MRRRYHLKCKCENATFRVEGNPDDTITLICVACEEEYDVRGYECDIHSREVMHDLEYGEVKYNG